MHATRFRPRPRRAAVWAFLAAILAVWVTPLAYADPPPWAPAHGYRAQGKHKHKYKHRYDEGYGEELSIAATIGDGRCNREAVGALLGGVAGGVLGSTVGKGDGRTAATVAGTVIGVLVGSSIGRSMDQADQLCTGQALEYAGDREPVEWVNPDTGARYQVTPTATYQDRTGRYCREYRTEATVAGKKDEIYGIACRQPDGSWQLSY